MIDLGILFITLLQFIPAETLSEFNFPDLLESLRSSDEMGTGKVVVRPDRYNSTWIHYSKNEDLTTRWEYIYIITDICII